MEPRFEVIPPVTQQRPIAPKKNIFQHLWGWIVAGLIALAKFKFLLLGALKTGLSMFVSIGIYALFFGWKYAAGIVVLIFVHEMGHVIAAKWLGIPVTAPLFIPFIGASILMKENPRDAWTEALMAYGGPLAGCIGSWICWFLALQLHVNWLLAVASTSFFINIFNMIPVPPLDGGRMCAAISPWFWIVGVVLLLGSLYVFHGPTSFIIILIVAYAAYHRIRETFFTPPTPAMQHYYNTHISNRLSMVVMYLGLLAALMLGYWDSVQHLSYVWDRQQVTDNLEPMPAPLERGLRLRFLLAGAVTAAEFAPLPLHDNLVNARMGRTRSRRDSDRWADYLPRPGAFPADCLSDSLPSVSPSDSSAASEGSISRKIIARAESQPASANTAPITASIASARMEPRCRPWLFSSPLDRE